MAIQNSTNGSSPSNDTKNNITKQASSSSNDTGINITKKDSSPSNDTDINTTENASPPSSNAGNNNDNNNNDAASSPVQDVSDNKAENDSPPSTVLQPFSEPDTPESVPSQTPPPSPPPKQSPPPSSPPPSPPLSPPPSRSSPPPLRSSPPPSQSSPPPVIASSPPPSPTASPPPTQTPTPPAQSQPTPQSPPPSPAGNPPSQQSPPQQSNSPSPSSPSPSSPSPSPSSPSPQIQTPPSPFSQVTPSIPTPASPLTQFIPPPPVLSGGSEPNNLPSQSPPVSNSNVNVTSSNSQMPSTAAGSGDKTGEYVGIAVAVVVVLAIVGAIVFFIFRRKKQQGGVYVVPPFKKGGGDVHYYVEDPAYVNGSKEHMGNGQIVFTYEKIVEITNNFSSENVIGEGGFGCVYKASMPDGRIGAIKMLKAGSGQGEREFRSEVDIISRIHHRHLVSLIGYCISEQQRVLIYEYVPNGNLNQHLHDSGKPALDWPKRTKIAIGAARGLAYLHEGCNPKIIHRDIKSANILLDDAYEAQVADFGLARLTDDANTHVSTRVMGTFGYMAPEYATSGKLTDRSDVFSFGVVLLELITGRKPVDPTQPIGDESLVEWARPLLLRAIETGDFAELVDPRLQRHYVDSEMFRMIEAAAACVRHSAPKRPSMVQVSRALDSGDQLYDLSNGVKFGQSTIYDSRQYNEDIARFRMMANSSFGDSEFGMYSKDYPSREISVPNNHTTMTYSSVGDSEVKPFHSQMRT